MSSTTTIANKLVMNKFVWMGRKLRNFNDTGSIINWSIAMSHVKGLLFESEALAPVPAKIQPRRLSLSSHLNRSSTPPIHPELSITPPNTICFQPSKKNSISKSPSYYSNVLPTKPSPLTIYNHRHPTNLPTNSFAPTPKRRKITIPPSVDYHASTTSITSRTISSQPVPTIATTYKPPPNSTLTAGSLTDGWLHCFDHTTRISYYWNQLTGATQKWSPNTHIGECQRKKPLNKT